MSFRRPGGSEKCAARDDAPGLPKVPAAEKIDVDENGKITGLAYNAIQLRALSLRASPQTGAAIRFL